MTTTFRLLSKILVSDYKVAPETLTPDVSLDELGIDSLGVAELLFNIEDAFQIALPPDPVNLTTVDDVVAYIDGLIVAQHGPDPQADVGTVQASLSP